ncbi:hypothetical protein ACJMK2_037870 [Sinanodonta woodiana]|uniref:SAM domain-containing protein n=1 Tax=Sinanodonta woodiana TaxID=1069815 RepID=A0ABD3WQA1_SINWO
MEMKSNNMFRDQVNSVTAWFSSWSQCEQTVALYSLLKMITPTQCRFLVQVLQQSPTENKEVQLKEEEANDPEFISKLMTEPEEKAITQLLAHLPLLQVGNIRAKSEYLKIIPRVLSHSIDKGVFIEESRQLLSYSLIHPAITSSERSKFTMWLGHLEERFTYNIYPHDRQNQGKPDSDQTQIHPSKDDLSKNVTHPKLQNGWNPKYGSADSVNRECLDPLCGSQNNMFPPNSFGSGPIPVTVSSNGQIINNCAHNNGLMTRGHLPLQATMSAPSGISHIVPNSITQNQQTNANRHPPLRRISPIIPPISLPVSSSVTDWLQSNDMHLTQDKSMSNATSEHPPLSPQSSVGSGSSGSGPESHPDDHLHSFRNTFMEEASGMRDVPLWLKSLRLHKYSYLFQQLTYEEMMNLSEQWLEQQNVTKGARHKIVLSIVKLKERPALLKALEKDIMEGGSLKSAITEMKNMLNSPIKSYCSPSDIPNPQMVSPPPSPTSGDQGDGSIPEADIPSQFTRVMGKVCTQLLTSRYDEECFNMYLQLVDKCINHEAFSAKQKKLLDTWKQQARRIWQPAPFKYGFDKKPRPNWGNTFPMGAVNNSRPLLQRSGRIPKPSTQWSFGSKRSLVGGTTSTGPIPLQRNNSLNIFSRPGLLDQAVKNPVTRTQSAPLRSAQQLGFSVPPGESSNDTDINAQLDSLCRSMTEHALGGSDGSERGSAF